MTATVVDLHPVRADSGLTLQQLVKSITHHIYVARDAEGKMGRSRLKAGREMLLLRQRVDAGDPEAEGLSWWKYYARDLKAHFRSRRDAERIMALAAADDPDLAQEEERAENAEQQRQSRKRKAATDVSRNHDATDIELTTEQVDLVDHVCQVMAETSDETRRTFFAILKGRLQI